MGISVGIRQRPRRPPPEIDITDLAPGRYVVLHNANLDRSLAERTYGNHTSRAASWIARDARGRLTAKLLRTR